MTSVLVTGASGFIGAALVDALRADGVAVRAVGRTRGDVRIAALNAQTEWRAALEGVSAVVHLAGPAHARFEEGVLRAAITDATAALAAQAAAVGVRRFVFISSIKAAAARTYERAISERDPPAPEDAYGRAKLYAERAVLAQPALRPVILRPPIVHAPDAKANFGALLRLVASGAPLPFAGVKNKRSVIARAALIEAIKAALGEGPSGVFHVCDQPALSTGEIISALRRGLGAKPNLFNAGPFAQLAPAALTENLESDDSAFRAAYGYGARAQIGAAEALAQTARAWKAAR
jgi:UDP-glucose 4-epimerase